jgi:diacylglycerol O-acyltransferase
MLRTYPIPPLLPNQALAIGVTSYDGSVFYGITADRDLVPDVDVLGQCVTEALTELLDTVTGGRPKIPRGRRKKAAPKP